MYFRLPMDSSEDKNIANLHTYQESSEVHTNQLEFIKNSDDDCKCKKCSDVTKRKSQALKSFRCKDCSFTAICKDRLKRHALEHRINEERIYKCDKCSYITGNEYFLTKHSIKHKGEVDTLQVYVCKDCEFVTKYKSSFNKHIKRHLNSNEGQVFKCAKCSYESTHKGFLGRHSQKHS